MESSISYRCLWCWTRTHAEAMVFGPRVMIVLAPDQAVDAEVVWQTIEIGQIGEQHEEGREYSHGDQDQRIGIWRGVVRRYLVPEGIEPEPRLPRIVARLVHHSPLRPQQVNWEAFVGSASSDKKSSGLVKSF